MPAAGPGSGGRQRVTAPTVFTALAAPLLVRAAPSILVHLGSGAAHQAYRDNAAYVASKHAPGRLSVLEAEPQPTRR